MPRQLPAFSSANNEQDDKWLKEFEKNLEKGAVQSRSQQSLFEQINSIMNGARSKFSTVNDVVEDMKERSGLTAYLSASKEDNVELNVKKTASEKPEVKLTKLEEEAFKFVKEKRWLEVGKSCGKIAKLIKGTNLKSKINKIKVPKPFADDWAMGYCQTFGQTLSQDEVKALKKKFASDVNNVFDKQIPAESNIQPIVIKKVPNIKKTIENYITSSKGTLSISAIIDKIKSIHKNDIPDINDWEDENLLRFISKLNLMAKKDNPTFYMEDSNLGKQETISDDEIDKSNYNAFDSFEVK